jgi:hypothetical protein
MGIDNHYFGKKESQIFLAEGLDTGMVLKRQAK